MNDDAVNAVNLPHLREAVPAGRQAARQEGKLKGRIYTYSSQERRKNYVRAGMVMYALAQRVSVEEENERYEGKGSESLRVKRKREMSIRKNIEQESQEDYEDKSVEKEI
jgi:hypothetical protein